MELVTTMMSNILSELATYQFLTVSKLERLTDKRASYIREMLARLSRFEYIKSYRIEVSYAVRSESLYFLLPKGIEFLQSHKNAHTEINAPVNSHVVAVKDYYHRLCVVQLHMETVKFFASNNIPLTCFYTYYNKVGSSRKGGLTAKTAIPVDGSIYIPDAVFKSEKALYLLEHYSDRDVKRVLTQLSTHTKALAEGTPAKMFNLPVNAKVLCSFSHASTKNAVVKKLQQSPGFAPMAGLFFFITYDDATNDFGNGWQTITGETLVFT